MCYNNDPSLSFQSSFLSILGNVLRLAGLLGREVRGRVKVGSRMRSVGQQVPSRERERARNKIVTRIPKELRKIAHKKKVMNEAGSFIGLALKARSERIFLRGGESRKRNLCFTASNGTCAHAAYRKSWSTHLHPYGGRLYGSSSRCPCGMWSQRRTAYAKKNETEQEVKAARIPCLPMLFKPASRAGQLNSISKRNP